MGVERTPRRSKSEASSLAGAETEKISVTLVNVDELAEDAAHDAAERSLTASKEEMKGFKGFFKKIWKHGVAREYYRQKQLARMREAIAESGDIFAAEQDPRIEKDAHEHAMRALVDRFSSEYEETLHEGEARRTVKDESFEDQQLSLGVKELIREYASGSLDDENFEEARKRLLQSVSENQTDAKKGTMYADNLLAVARQVKLAVEHGKSIDDLDYEIKLGRAKNSIRTQAQYNAVDKVIEKVKNIKGVGVLVNEATLATGVATAYAVGAGLTKSALSSRAASLLTFGGSALIAGGFTGLAENKRFKEDRRQHGREMAQGRTYEHGESPRREDMDKYLYEMAGASELTNTLRSRLYEENMEGKFEARKLSEEERNTVIAHLADIEARIQLSDREAIDLVSYQSATSIEQERLDLDIARAQTKVELRKMIEGAADGEKLDDVLKVATDARIEALTKGEEGIEEKNALFRKAKRKKVAIAAVKGVALGLVIGGVAQEGMAFADDSKVGFTEHLIRGNDVLADGSTHTTPVETLRNLIAGNAPAGGEATHETALGAHSHLKLPESLTLHPTDHGYELLQDGAVVADGISVNADGSLDEESLHALTEKGFIVAQEVAQVKETVAGQLSPAEYLEAHEKLGTHVSRELWFDNDTPKPVFDKNELRLWWGGENNIGLTPDGKYSFTVDHMTADGSYHNGLSVNAGELVQEGKMKMLFSLSADTQAHPIEVPIGPDGTVQIDPNSEVGKLLFETVDGKPHFLGRFAEVAEVVSTDADHTDHVRILATYEGEGLSEIPTAQVTSIPEHTTVITTPKDYMTELPPIIPIFGRKPLEPTESTQRGPVPFVALPPMGVYYGRIAATPEQRKEYETKMSEELRTNPDAILNAKEQGTKYLDSLDSAYRARVNVLAEQAGEMTPECTAAVCIPVAGHQEAENIERTLSCYLDQTSDAKSHEIVLFVNWPDKDQNGNPITADETLKKIQEFKEQHPEMPIRVMETVLPREEAKIGNIRKLLNDATIARSIAREGDGEVVLISNDADTRGIAPTYIENFQKKFSENKNTEAFFGQLDWDPESYIRNPLVHIGARLYHYIALQHRRAGGGIESSGANFAFRSSIYSAIGGYSTDIGLGEDNDLGRRIVYARARGTAHTPISFAGARVSRVYTSSRRAEKAVQDGRSFIEQWNNGFSAFDDEVRKVKWEETRDAPDYDNPEVVEKLTRELEATINRTLKVAGGWWSGKTFSPFARRALGLLGVKYKIVAPYRIEITDASRLIAGLKEYKEDGLEIMKRKIAAPGTRRNRPRTGNIRRKAA